jgi:hypothetical protein
VSARKCSAAVPKCSAAVPGGVTWDGEDRVMSEHGGLRRGRRCKRGEEEVPGARWSPPNAQPPSSAASCGETTLGIPQ